MPIDFSIKGRIACITINRPEAMNALDDETAVQLQEALQRFKEDDSLWVAIITGAGDKAFCAGGDLGSGVGHTRSWAYGLEVWKPLIAAVNGYCLGGGLALALACDVRIASDSASFATMGTLRGIVPGGGQTQRLWRVVGLGRAMEMVLWANRINAAEALRIGLVNRVVPASDLMAAAFAWAEELCERAPLAVRAAKQAVIRGLGIDLEGALELERSLALPIRQTEDAAEGARAFAEKRRPVFQGR